MADVIEEHAGELVQVETRSNGKPIREARAIDVAYAADHLRYFADALLAGTGEADILPGNMLSLMLHEPISVEGKIVPWNAPFL